METATKRAKTEASTSLPLASSSSSSSSSSQRALEIRVISGEDLRISRRQSAKNSFVVIKTDSASSSSYQDQRTKMNKGGGSNPAWDEKLVLDMPMHARFITVEVQCKTNGSNRIIGTANIPASDFIGSLVPENYLHFLSYRLRDTQGERNGIINLSVRVRNAGIGTPPNFAPIPSGFSIQQQPPSPWTAGVPADARISYNHGQVVTGIPVRLPNF